MEYIFNCVLKLFKYIYGNGTITTQEMIIGFITLIVIVLLFSIACIALKKYLKK